MVPRSGFPSRPGRRDLDAVVDRVADHVDERIAQLLHDVTIQFGLLAFQDKLHLLPLLRGEIAHQAGHLVKHRANRDHAQ